MTIPILQTKVYRPPPPPKLVLRPRLIQRLNEGLHCKLTLIAAQAGAGKTTLASVWLNQLEHDAAWLSLDEADSDPVRLWLYVAAALQTVRPTLGRSIQTMLETPAAPSFEILLTGLLNEVAALPDHFVLVLDDYHHVTDPQTHRTLAFFLDHLPPQLHLVLLTREDPPLPLARYRVHRQISEVRFHHLHFTSQEAGQFLNQTMGLNLRPHDVVTLVQRTEGWAAGLQLAALSLQNQTETTDAIQRFAGDDRYLVDYLMAEVLEHQPPHLRTFLLQTSILKRFSVSLCNAVTTRTDCRTLLSQLEDANLFLIPLDNRRQWFRYHRLFSDLLHFRLQEEWKPEDVRLLHARAGDWHARQENVDEAVHQYLAAGDYERAAEQFEPVGIHLLVRGQLRQVLDWLTAFPEDVLKRRPLLCVCQAWVLNISGQADGVEQWLVRAEAVLPEAPPELQREVRGLINTVRSYVARKHNHMTRSMQYLHQALEDLPAHNLLVRSSVNLNLGFNYSIVGELALADQALAAAVLEGQQCRAVYIMLIAMAVRANVYAAQGRLAAAQQLYQAAIDYGLEQSGGQPFPLAGYAYAGLGRVLYEQNQLAAAEWHLQQAVTCGEQIGDWSMTRRGLLPLAWLRQIQGDAEAADRLWQRAFSVVQQAGSDRIAAQLRVHQAMLWLVRFQSSTDAFAVRDAHLAAAAAWAAAYEQNRSDPLSYSESLAQTALSWLDFLRGQMDRALSRLEPLVQFAEAGGYGDNLIKALALTVLVHEVRGDRAAALNCMQRTLAAAVPQSYVRTFVDLGWPMRRFLQIPEVAEIAPDYVVGLLQAFHGDDTEPEEPTRYSRPLAQQPISGATTSAESSARFWPDPSPPPVLVEPLNERERQILDRMAARQSNQQMADELYLSINTVKWHARNLYAKLGVSGRVEAVDRARELLLL